MKASNYNLDQMLGERTHIEGAQKLYDNQLAQYRYFHDIVPADNNYHPRIPKKFSLIL